jgi:hypothetical protein
MKKKIGIILIIISSLNMITWIFDASKGKTGGAFYYIFVIALFIVGFNLIVDNKKSSKTTSDTPSSPTPYYRKENIELKLKDGLVTVLKKTLDKVKTEPDVVRDLIIKKSAIDYMTSIKTGYPSIVNTCKEVNTPVPCSKREYEAMIDRITEEILLKFVKTNSQDCAG